MEFHHKLYELRKQRGFSQEELAHRLHVSRQTVSKWELGDSTPDMEKLIAMSDLFEISLDALVLDKTSPQAETSAQQEIIHEIGQKVFTDANKTKAKCALKIGLIVLGAVLLIDIISMIVYFVLYGFPE